MRVFDKEEVIVVGVLLKTRKKVTLPEDYKCIFKGKTEIEPGSYVYWYPAKNTSCARMIHELERWYDFKTEYGVLGSMEI